MWHWIVLLLVGIAGALEWLEVPGTFPGGYQHVVAVPNDTDHVYVFGGFDTATEAATDRLYKYNVRTGVESTIASSGDGPPGLFGATHGVHDGTWFFALGEGDEPCEEGEDCPFGRIRKVYNFVWSLDLTSFTWTTLYSGALDVSQGENSGNKYELSETLGRDAPIPRYGSPGGILVHEGVPHLLITLGVNFDVRLETTWSFNLESNEWINLEPGYVGGSPIRRCFPGNAIVYPDNEATAGYGEDSGEPLLFLFGGTSSGHGPFALLDGYTIGMQDVPFLGSPWSGVKSGPTPVAFPQLSRWYGDELRDNGSATILYGGLFSATESGTARSDELHIFSGTEWFSLTPDTSVSPGGRHAGTLTAVPLSAGEGVGYLLLGGLEGVWEVGEADLSGNFLLHPSSSSQATVGPTEEKSLSEAKATGEHIAKVLIYVSEVLWNVMWCGAMIVYLLRDTLPGRILKHYNFRYQSDDLAVAATSVGQVLIFLVWSASLATAFAGVYIMCGLARAAGGAAMSFVTSIMVLSISMFSPLQRSRLIHWHITGASFVLVFRMIHGVMMLVEKLPIAYAHHQIAGITALAAMVVVYMSAYTAMYFNKREWFTIGHFFVYIISFSLMVHSRAALQNGAILFSLHFASRVIRVVRQLTSTWTVSSYHLLSEDMEITVRLQRGFSSNYRGGQYFLLRVPELSLLESHPFSAASPPGKNTITFLVKNMGAGTWTDKLQSLIIQKPNLRIFLDGPYNDSAITLQSQDSLVLLGGGIGVSCIASWAGELAQRWQYEELLKERSVLTLPLPFSAPKPKMVNGTAVVIDQASCEKFSSRTIGGRTLPPEASRCDGRNWWADLRFWLRLRGRPTPLKKVMVVFSFRDPALLVSETAKFLYSLRTVPIFDIRFHYTGTIPLKEAHGVCLTPGRPEHERGLTGITLGADLDAGASTTRSMFTSRSLLSARSGGLSARLHEGESATAAASLAKNNGPVPSPLAHRNEVYGVFGTSESHELREVTSTARAIPLNLEAVKGNRGVSHQVSLREEFGSRHWTMSDLDPAYLEFVRCGRPHIKACVAEAAGASSQARVGVIACGSGGFMRAVRHACPFFFDTTTRVEVHGESFIYSGANSGVKERLRPDGRGGGSSTLAESFTVPPPVPRSQGSKEPHAVLMEVPLPGAVSEPPVAQKITNDPPLSEQRMSSVYGFQDRLLVGSVARATPPILELSPTGSSVASADSLFVPEPTRPLVAVSEGILDAFDGEEDFSDLPLRE